MMAIHTLRISEEDELKKKATRLVEEVSGGKVTMVKASLLSENAIVLVDNGASTSIWVCRNMTSKIIGMRILSGNAVSIVSSKLVDDREGSGFDICVDLRRITYVDCFSLTIEASPEKNRLRVKLFKSTKSLLEDLLKGGAK